MNIEESIKLVYKAIDDKQGEDIKILKIGNISSLADYFIITSASNERQVKLPFVNSYYSTCYKPSGSYNSCRSLNW